jgi:hypothetical protein
MMGRFYSYRSSKTLPHSPRGWRFSLLLFSSGASSCQAAAAHLKRGRAIFFVDAKQMTCHSPLRLFSGSVSR